MSAIEPPTIKKAWYVPGIKEILEYMMNSPEFMEKRWDEVNHSPVFKTYAGLPMTVLADHTSVSHFCAQPETVLNRQQKVGFGPKGGDPAMWGARPPVIQTTSELGHLQARDFATKMIHSRIPTLQHNFKKASDFILPQMAVTLAADVASIPLTTFTWTYAMEFMYQFLYEAHAPPNAAELMKDYVRQVSGHPHTNCFTTNLALKVVMPLANRGHMSANELNDVLMPIIRGSPVWQKYIAMAKEENFDITDIDKMVGYFVNLNAAPGLGGMISASLASLKEFQEGFLEKLRDEIDTMGGEITKEKVDNATEYPLLEALHDEAQRLFFAPWGVFRQAVHDMEVPAGNGITYAVKKGELVCGFFMLAHRDPAVFGDTAREFNPMRFVENPDLKRKVMNYFFLNNDESTLQSQDYGCPAHKVGVIKSLFKMLIARIIRDFDFGLAGSVNIDRPHLGTFGPEDLQFSYFRPRQHVNTSEEKEDAE